MEFLTDFADEAVILPLTLAVGLTLAVAGWRRGAAAWLVGIAVTLAVVLLAKLVAHACAPLPLVSLQSPSGHTAAAAVVYGGLLALSAPRGWRTPLLAAAAALAIAVLIGGSRIALGVHSRSDVLVGALLGVAGAVLLARLAGPRPPGLHRVLPLAAALAIVIIFHGAHLHAEDGIVRFSHTFWPLTLCRVPGVEG
jgi:membrane-associated phospholipid phosphatase